MVSSYGFVSDVGDDVLLVLVSIWCPCSQLTPLVRGHPSFVVCVPQLIGSGTRFTYLSDIYNDKASSGLQRMVIYLDVPIVETTLYFPHFVSYLQNKDITHN